MGFLDSAKSIWNRLNEPISQEGSNASENNLPNGGHTGFQPRVQARRRMNLVERLFNGSGEDGDQAPAQEPEQNHQFQQNYDQNYAASSNRRRPRAPQNQPAAQPQQGFGGQQPYTAPRQGFGGQQPYTAPQQGFGGQQPYTAPQQGFGGQQPYTAPQQGFGGQNGTAPQQNGFGSNAAGRNAPQSASSGFGSFVRYREAARQQTDPQPQPAEQPSAPQAPAGGNVLYMNGFTGADGMSYRHVEEIASITRMADCFRLSEFMRLGYTVIVCMDMVHDEQEIQRCADLLYGAAFVMRYRVHRISLTETYMLTPASVLVQTYQVMQRMNDVDASTRWPGAAAARQEENAGMNWRPAQPMDAARMYQG